jgi:hypothetical protein
LFLVASVSVDGRKIKIRPIIPADHNGILPILLVNPLVLMQTVGAPMIFRFPV